MVQAGGGLCLATEPVHELLVARVVRREHLDRDGAIQDAVGAVVHGGHAAGAELVAQLVAIVQNLGGHGLSPTRWGERSPATGLPSSVRARDVRGRGRQAGRSARGTEGRWPPTASGTSKRA